ncbi:MAG: hypothetical protein J7L94_00405 [Caldisericaceae bacterium]|nr:hypothetical protein [Caldisericaceae bacterium]
MTNFATPNEIDYLLAYNAHRGTSFIPEQRAQQEQKDYANHINSVYTEIMGMARNDEERTIAEEELQRYKKGYKKKFEALLTAKSRTISPMITGSAKFPTARNEKTLTTERARLEDLIEFDKKTIEKIKQKLRPERAPISSTDSDAVRKLQNKIEEKEKFQQMMKTANKIVRNKKLSKSEKTEKLQQELNLSKTTAEKLLEPDYIGRIGFADYELRNNNSEIRRLKKRLEEIQARKQKAETLGGPQEIDFEGGTIEINYDDGYVRIFYDNKPNADTRNRLKQNGFRWAPSEKAWRRKLTDAARYKAKIVTGVNIEC